VETAFELYEKRIKEAYKEANNTIYFNDNSDYLAALYTVCEILSPSVDSETIGTNYIE
jgi:hypothetical protein